MSMFVALGAPALIAGLAVLVMGLRAPAGEPKRTAMLIGGTMAAAFGLVIAGFAIAWELTPPLDLGDAR
ncbi:MAG TPA: hypothetical protein VF079_02035 [Sphingomicrobium sp.]